MKISFWIPAVVLYVVRAVSSNSVQVGTVLFTTTDLVKKCWTESDKSLLKARLIMQDVLPDPDCIDFSNPKAVAILLEYFHSCFQIIATCTYGKIQNLMYLALSDALGGYLRAYVLPFTRKAYYAGQVTYSDASKLFQLYGDIKTFLKTNGVGWAEPRCVCIRNFQVKPLMVEGGALEACKELYTIEKEGKIHCVDPTNCKRQKKKKKKSKKCNKCSNTVKFVSSDRVSRYFPPRYSSRHRRKREKCLDFNFCNATDNYNGTEPLLKELARKVSQNKTRDNTQCTAKMICKSQEECKEPKNTPTEKTMRRVIIPLPVLDNCYNPHSIAIPFKKYPFRNLKCGDSAFILEHYYLSVVRCFIAMGNSRRDIKVFNSQLRTWLTNQVVPHLCKEEWYPGFGGVLRVIQTIKKFGTDDGYKDAGFQDIAFMFDQGIEFEFEDSFKEKAKDKVRDVGMNNFGDKSPSYKRHLIYTSLIVSVFWLLFFFAFAFYYQARNKRRSGRRSQPCRPRSPPRQPCRSRSPPRQPRQPRQPCRPRSPSRQPCRSRSPPCQPQRPKCDPKQSGPIDFQFLIKFFKRKNECFQEAVKPPCAPHKHRETENIQKKHSSPPAEPLMPDYCKERTVEYVTTLTPSVPPKQPHPVKWWETSSRRPEEHRGHGDQVRTLWKKPSATQARFLFRKGREKKTRKKKSLRVISETTSSSIPDKSFSTRTHSCSECYKGKDRILERTTSASCSRYTCERTSTSSSSSPSQGQENLSSATMEFFEEVIARHQAKTLVSTAETETECSTTSTATGY